MTEGDDPSHYGVVEQGNNGEIIHFVEKPKKADAPSNRVNVGIYIMERCVLDYILQDGRYPSRRRHFEIWLGDRVRMGQGVLFVPPVMIGNGSRIGSKVRMPKSILWDRCKIESGTEWHDCIFGSGSLASPHNLYEAVCNRNLEVQQH